MRFTFSSHALLRMRERGIRRSDVREAIENPDRHERSSRRSNRYLAKKVYLNRRLHRQHLLLVIYERERRSTRIVTVIDTSKIAKYL